MVKNNIIVKFFSYSPKGKDWPYGSGFVITHPQRDEPLWYKMMDGDFGPHSVSLLDLNGDGKLDLFSMLGLRTFFLPMPILRTTKILYLSLSAIIISWKLTQMKMTTLFC